MKIDQGAFLLVVKSSDPNEVYAPYIKGLIDMKAALDLDWKNGNKFYFNKLAPNHPAIQFARSVNPNFDEFLNNIPY